MKSSLKSKLVFQFMLNGILPMLITSIIAYNFASDFLVESKFDKLASIEQLKKSEVQRYFKTIENQVITFSEDKMIVDAAVQLQDAFQSIVSENSLDANRISSMKSQIQNYYLNNFASEFRKHNSDDPGTMELLKGLKPAETALQYYYISNNENPLGSKHLLDKANDSSQYSQIHHSFHPPIRDYLEKFGYYDIFIADAKTGLIVYSVFKEIDFATSLIDGPYSQSGIGKVFQLANSLSDMHSTAFVDYAQYLPSYNAPASFIASPIFHKGKKVAILIFQMPIGTINEIMTATEGMGETGESILIGPDQLPRSDSRIDPENRGVVSAFRKPEVGKISNGEANLALGGKSGVTISENHLGKEAIISYRPVNILGFEWAIISQVEVSEALAPVNKLAWSMTLIAILSAFCSIILGVFVAKYISAPILSIASQLKASSKQVGGAAIDVSHSSRQLAELATEQANSITETAASIEEISGMVKNNVEQARKSSDNSKQVMEKADSGNQSMSGLIKSMGQITESNEKIGALVKVIEEIGDKTEIIDEIVFQTKLLSFNASVEAERAGEHGRGFAVVAQEVGNLAQMSGKASLEIASMVKDSLKNAEAITGENRKRVESANTLVQSTAKHLNEIAFEAENLFSQSSQIVNSSKEQSEGIIQVNEAMNQLDQTTQLNSETAEKSANSSETMETLASELKDLVVNLLTFINGSKADPLNQKILENKPKSPHETVIGLDRFRPKVNQNEKKKIAVGESSNSSNQNSGGWESI